MGKEGEGNWRNGGPYPLLPTGRMSNQAETPPFFFFLLKEDAWSVKYESIELCCSQRTNNHHKFKCFQGKFIYGV